MAHAVENLWYSEHQAWYELYSTVPNTGCDINIGLVALGQWNFCQGQFIGHIIVMEF